VDGFFVVDKPQGVTSFAMVALLRRLTGVRRAGHAGTLDPLATGVLVIAVGQATRLIRFTEDAPKEYRARVRFGIATDTYDAEGAVTAIGDASMLDEDGLRALLPRFTGQIEQRPPAYSAIKLAGKPLYRYARQGAPVEPAARPVFVERIDLRSFDASTHEAELDVVCGKGTYIRSLAHDLGQLAGCGAHLAGLRRAASSGFTLADASTPDELTAATADSRLDEMLLAPDRAVEALGAAILGSASTDRLGQGRDLALPGVAGYEWCRAYSTEGSFVGVLASRGGSLWHPEIVFSGLQGR
jgi:tRNA pseudouridine55 synthase